MTPVPGQPNVYDLVMVDAPTEAGTPPTKANLFTDATDAAIFGTAANRTVDAALGQLAISSRVLGTCITPAATTAKTATLPGFVRSTGSRVTINFTYANTAASPTLIIGGAGSTIRDFRTGLPPAPGTMVAGKHEFLFDGSSWILLNPAQQIEIGRYTGMGTGTAASPVLIPTAFSPRRVEITGYNSGSGISYICYKTASRAINNMSINGNWNAAVNTSFLCVAGGFNVGTADIGGTGNPGLNTNVNTVEYDYIAYG